MGRRPNGLITEFFERGEKLPNQSNRYRHTCKKCGEVFPKGRVDALTTHLIQRCPHITNKDRGWIVEQIKQNPTKIPLAGAEVIPDLQRQHPPERTFSYDELRQQQSALDTLAEVSRRHLNYSTQNGTDDNRRPSNDQVPNNTFTEQAFFEQLQTYANSSIPISQANPTATATSSSEGQDPFVLSTTEAVQATSTCVTSGLVQTASEANQHLESFREPSASPSNHPDPIDPHLDLMGGQLQAQTAFQSINEPENNDRRQGRGGNDSTRIPPIVSFSRGPPSKPSPKKVRGQFSDGRRKEVASVRKAGACLRCRVLKKPCSGETPCNSCSSIATARIWKDSCTRTRLVDELTLYSSQLFYARSSLEVSSAGYGFDRAIVPGTIEARVFTTSDLSVSFSVRGFLRGSDTSNQILDAAMLTNGHTHLLIDDADRAADRLGLYVQRAAGILIQDERSPFVKATVEEALALAAAAEEHDNAAQDDEANKTKHVHQRLPDTAVELWALTRLLTTLDEFPLQLRYNGMGSASLEPQKTSWQDDLAQTPSFQIPSATLSYQLIRTQMLASIETRCRRLSTDITNELERRLLLRKESSQFTTLISAVILLNCVERMTGFYAYNDATQSGTTSAQNGRVSDPSINVETEADPSPDNATASPTSDPKLPPNWPIDTPPSTLWRQGPPFTALLTMLLRLRNLPPRVAPTEYGTLAVIQSSFNVHNGKAVEQQQQQATLLKAVADWLNPLQLNVEELVAKRDGDVPARAEGLEAWDMVFVSKVLLGERVGSL